jgi:heterodisulfide reductase subunit B
MHEGETEGRERSIHLEKIMKIPFYPGCTLKTNALNFERSAIAVSSALGLELDEIPRWNCCGTVFALSSDSVMNQIAPIRNLIRVKDSGSDRVVTLCSMCFNTLKRANERMKDDEENLRRINDFMDRENDYDGSVKVLHLLETLRDEVGFDAVREKTVHSLNGLKVASYYGCMLLRPDEIGIDDPENPTIMESLIEALGGDSVESPFRNECCGSYQTVDNPGVVAERTYTILSSSLKRGADVVMTSCPLCAFNLDNRQELTKTLHRDLKQIPVLYFTQLMALALGLDPSVCMFELNYVDPLPVLKEKGILPSE